MTAGDLALVVVVVVAVGALAVLAALTTSMLRTLRELRDTVDLLERESVAVLAEMRQTAQAAGMDVDRIDELLDAAESISATVEGASRFGYVAFRRPLVKLVAFWRGIARALRRAVRLGGRAA